MNKIKETTEDIRVYSCFQDARQAAHNHFNLLEKDDWGSLLVSQKEIDGIIHLTFVSYKHNSTNGEFIARIQA